VSKKIIGIIGGIGSGKSAAATEFAKLGCGLVDADKIAHELLDEPEVQKQIIVLFGPAVLNSAGKIDRKKLAGIVFSDSCKLSSLNKLIHPLVLARAEQLIGEYNRQKNVKAIVLDIPLLVEVGWDKRCDKLVFVNCNRQLRAERIQKKGDLDENQLKIRENFQIFLDNKIDLADNVIDNSYDFAILVKQVNKVFFSIMGNG
jgi:dephospho-CoA kinase